MPITTNELPLLEMMKAMQLIAATKEHAAKNTLLDLTMPNGKRLRDCTGKECREVGEWMAVMAAHFDNLNDGQADEQANAHGGNRGRASIQTKQKAD